jgi:hypothetical protein
VQRHLSSDVALRVFEFAVALSSAARIFTAKQLARHPELSWRAQPERRAKEVLNLYAESFEQIPGPYGEPFRWRLSRKERAKRGIKQTAISGTTNKSHHWLGIGDIWLELTFHGGRPTEWRTEPDGQFDIYCVWRDIPLLIEYQRTPITERQWKAKWERRIQWYRTQKWEQPPRVVLVNTTGQQEGTLHLPRNTIHVRDINHLHHALRTPRV